MCVIIHKPAGVKLSHDYIKEAEKYNRHGAGIMWYDKEKKKIQHWKDVKYDIDKICDFVDLHTDTEMCLHFRIKTHGTEKKENCHPFRVLSSEKNRVDMLMMHNGIIRDVDTEGDETDSMAFVRKIARPILRHKPSLITTDAVHTLFAKFIGSSKLCFMYADGRVEIINRKDGVERDGCWFSNTSAFPYTYNAKANQTSTSQAASNTTVGQYGTRVQQSASIQGVTVYPGEDLWVLDPTSPDPKFMLAEIVELREHSADIALMLENGQIVNCILTYSTGSFWYQQKQYYVIVPEITDNASAKEYSNSDVAFQLKEAGMDENGNELPETKPDAEEVAAEAAKAGETCGVGPNATDIKVCGDSCSIPDQKKVNDKVSVSENVLNDIPAGYFLGSIYELFQEDGEKGISILDFANLTDSEQAAFTVKSPKTIGTMTKQLVENFMLGGNADEDIDYWHDPQAGMTYYWDITDVLEVKSTKKDTVN